MLLESIPDLTPQNKYENLMGTLNDIAEGLEANIKLEAFNEDSWIEFVDKNLEKFDHSYGPDHLNENELHANDATWTQSDNQIMITLLTQKDKIKVDETGIECDVIKGKWWGPVKDIEVTSIGEEDNEITQITFSTTFTWPVLIKYGNPDAISAYYIALVALELERRDFFMMYLSYSAKNGCASSIRAYSLMCLESGRMEEAVYWNIQAINKFGDLLCGHVLAGLLAKGKGVKKDARLAEYILCRLVNEGFADAWYSLGVMYYEGNDGVEKNEEKAKFLFLFSAYQLNDERAMEYVEKLGLSIPQVTDNEEPQIITDPENINNENNTNNQENENADETQEKTSVVDWAIAGSVVATVGAAGLYAANKILRFISKK